MFKRKSLLLALLLPAGMLFAVRKHSKKAISHRSATAKHLATSNNAKIVAWDIHKMLFTEPDGHGWECLPKMDTFKIVEELHNNGIQQVILSNISHKSFGKLSMNNAPLMKYFNFSGSLGDSSGIFNRKPHGKYYKQFLRKNSGIAPKNIIFFDDKAKNICGACEQGMTAVQFCNASQARQKLVQLKVL